jgi:electron transfer flavoprotein beta subunit
MRIVVLLKQVPENLSVPMNEDYTIDRRGPGKITNPADLSALAMALDWKKRLRGQVLCVSMGPGSAVDTLREAAMTGADALYHICDPKAAGSDTLVTATILAAMIRKLGDIDLIFCGRHSVDGETGQVGAELAVLLDFACLSQVINIERIGEKEVECNCLWEEGTERYLVRRPAILCVCESRRVEQLPSLAMMRRARTMPINQLTLIDLGLSGIKGKQDSPTKVIAVHRKENRRRATVWLREDVPQTLCRLLTKRDG